MGGGLNEIPVPLPRGTKIIYNEIDYKVTDGVTENENYIVEKIASNKFKLTYTFTAENLPKAN